MGRGGERNVQPSNLLDKPWLAHLEYGCIASPPGCRFPVPTALGQRFPVGIGFMLNTSYRAHLISNFKFRDFCFVFAPSIFAFATGPANPSQLQPDHLYLKAVLHD